MRSVISSEDLRVCIQNWSKPIVLVPTMGALHAGHLKLVETAKAQDGKVIVSIFVNPMQFGPKEDFANYPRPLAKDVEALTSQGLCDVLFVPNAGAVYPYGFSTHIYNTRLASELCGRTRPQHFEGVLTVVAKLLFLTSADVLVMGKKDYQQLVLIRQMLRDLHIPVDLIGVETHREADGLAMSSRNQYLSETQRLQAASICAALAAMRNAALSGERDSAALRAVFGKHLDPIIEIEYLELRRSIDLGVLEDDYMHTAGDYVTMFAGRLGSTRLIDNIFFSI